MYFQFLSKQLDKAKDVGKQGDTSIDDTTQSFKKTKSKSRLSKVFKIPDTPPRVENTTTSSTQEQESPSTSSSSAPAYKGKGKGKNRVNAVSQCSSTQKQIWDAQETINSLELFLESHAVLITKAIFFKAYSNLFFLYTLGFASERTTRVFESNFSRQQETSSFGGDSKN